jgi:thiamine biosynthesis protein ThiS
LRVQINGEAREVADELKLSELVKELSLAPQRVAIELNQQIVRRNLWPTTILADGDRIEIVHFVGGGNGRKQ